MPNVRCLASLLVIPNGNRAIHCLWGELSLIHTKHGQTRGTNFSIIPERLYIVFLYTSLSTDFLFLSYPGSDKNF